MSIQLKLNLSDSQLHKLHKGETVQIKNNQMGTGREFQLHPENAKKIVKALKNGTGVRLSVSEAEISGSGVFGKKADNWMKKKGIKKTMYNIGSAVKPLVKDAISSVANVASQYGIPTKGAEKFAQAYIDNPEAQQAKIRKMANNVKGEFKQARSDYNNGTMGSIDDILGSGVRRRMKGRGVNPYLPIRGGSIANTKSKYHGRTKLITDQRNFIDSENANYYPTKPQSYLNEQHGIQKIGGGSFRQTGGSFRN